MRELPVDSVFQRPASSRAVTIYAGFLVAWAIFLLIIGPSWFFDFLIIGHIGVGLVISLLVYRNRKPTYRELIMVVLSALIVDTVVLWVLQPVSLG